MIYEKVENKKVMPIGRQGFTLIEIIMAMGIMAFLSATMFQIVSVSETKQGLIMASDKIKAGLKLAQSYSLANPQKSTLKIVCGYGLHITEGSSSAQIYYLFNNDFNNHPDYCNKSAYLQYIPPNNTLAKTDDAVIDLGTGYSITATDIFFKAPYGEVYSDSKKLTGSQTETFTITKGSGSMTIIVNAGGKVSYN